MLCLVVVRLESSGSVIFSHIRRLQPTIPTSNVLQVGLFELAALFQLFEKHSQFAIFHQQSDNHVSFLARHWPLQCRSAIFTSPYVPPKFIVSTFDFHFPILTNSNIAATERPVAWTIFCLSWDQKKQTPAALCWLYHVPASLHLLRSSICFTSLLGLC